MARRAGRQQLESFGGGRLLQVAFVPIKYLLRQLTDCTANKPAQLVQETTASLNADPLSLCNSKGEQKAVSPTA